MTGSLRELRARWSDSGRRDLVKDAVNALLAGDSLTGLPIGRHAGRFDLRASWLVSTRGVNDPTLAGRLGAVPTLRNITIADVDFTASTARLNLDGCLMANCVLDRVGWQGWSVRRSQMRTAPSPGPTCVTATLTQEKTSKRLPADPGTITALAASTGAVTSPGRAPALTLAGETRCSKTACSPTRPSPTTRAPSFMAHHLQAARSPGTTRAWSSATPASRLACQNHSSQ